jgi:hypothetical protein
MIQGTIDEWRNKAREDEATQFSLNFKMKNIFLLAVGVGAIITTLILIKKR